jgi:hypothetical protein
MLQCKKCGAAQKVHRREWKRIGSFVKDAAERPTMDTMHYRKLFGPEPFDLREVQILNPRLRAFDQAQAATSKLS